MIKSRNYGTSFRGATQAPSGGKIKAPSLGRGFLLKGKEQAFEELMRQVIKKELFSKAIENAYKVKLTVLWDTFIKERGNTEERQGYQLLLQHRKPICGFAAPLNPGETV